MKNSVVCPNCKSENPFYNSVCLDCRYFLRDRVYNIDLWSLISSLIENPGKAFQTVIFSEHKNFIFFILTILSIKFLINARFISMITLGDFQSTIGWQISYSIILFGTLLFFFVFSHLYNIIGRATNTYLRFKDTFSLIVYAHIPLVFGLIVLFTMELVVFGDYLFSINPTPFTIKGPIAFLFLIIEIGIIIWSIFLLFKAFLSQSNNFNFSLGAAVVFLAFSSIMIYVYSLFVFTI